MTVGDLDRSVAFYTRALGFALEDEAALEGEAFARLMGVASARARSATLALGDERIELLAFETPGEPYPSESHGPDLWFQHFAIVVDDMRQAFGRLCDAGLSPISTDGPQILPSRSGGATAFKFRRTSARAARLRGRAGAGQMAGSVAGPAAGHRPFRDRGGRHRPQRGVLCRHARPAATRAFGQQGRRAGAPRRHLQRRRRGDRSRNRRRQRPACRAALLPGAANRTPDPSHHQERRDRGDEAGVGNRGAGCRCPPAREPSPCATPTAIN